MIKTEKNKKKLSFWIKGLIVFILIILGFGILIGVYISKQLSGARVEMANSFVNSVEKYEKEGSVSGESLNLLKEMAGIINTPGATTWAVLLTNGIVYQAMTDRQITDQEFQDIQLVDTFLRKTNGKISFAQCGTFLNDNPRIKTAFESMKKQ